MKTSKIVFAIVAISLLLSTCKENIVIENECTQFHSLIEDSVSYAIDIPPHVIRAVRTGGYYDQSLNLMDLPSNSTIESFIVDEKAKLGRVLFYDTQLSLDNRVSCGTCHIQEKSFAEGIALSIGINNSIGTRNAMNLENVIFYPSSGGYGWGEGSAILEDQIKAAILNPKEMKMTEAALVEKVSTNCYYEGLFIAAYGSYEVTPTLVYDAIAQFIASMTAYDSKYDQGRKDVNNINLDFPTFNPLQNSGKTLFITNCASCHSLEVFKGAVASNIGLDLEYDDKGFGSVTGDPADFGKFKTPSLRNIMETAPYMHDGRFVNIDEVLEFYSEDIQAHPNLDSRLKDGSGNPKKFDFEEFEIDQLKAFLETLTDNTFLQDDRFSDPFNN